ncbi:MAG: lysophospholipid acyltransferase family protein [Candidatus Cloacimonetes bacterium]|nr:lysophospholipid acyltransferase family protein [Candidatus Cloacimonadota bacterium]MDD4559963.1 lysophospholipid acyltransferase family protein [Candidatus Cloacimonadota bacterium]
MISAFWKIWFICFMFVCLLAYILLIICKVLLPKGAYRKVVYIFVRYWGRTTVLSTGSKVEVCGLDKLPYSQSICFISNHQGMFDIPLFLGFIGRPGGFIAKKELFKIPVLSWWMKEIPCVFIDRSSARKAIETFQKSAEVIKAGHPMVIFPEGTRSQSDMMGDFHLGSFKLPAMAEATIVPLVIKNTWRVYETDKQIKPAELKMRVLEPIEPHDTIYKDKHALAEEIYNRIKTALAEM